MFSWSPLGKCKVILWRSNARICKLALFLLVHNHENTDPWIIIFYLKGPTQLGILQYFKIRPILLHFYLSLWIQNKMTHWKRKLTQYKNIFWFLTHKTVHQNNTQLIKSKPFLLLLCVSIRSKPFTRIKYVKSVILDLQSVLKSSTHW